LPQQKQVIAQASKHIGKNQTIMAVKSTKPVQKSVPEKQVKAEAAKPKAAAVVAAKPVAKKKK